MGRRRNGLTCVGADTGATGLRAVQLRRADGAVEVVHSARWEGRRGDETHAPSGEEVSGCLGHGGFRGRRVTAVLHPPDVDFFALELPRTDESDVEAAVRHEVERLAGPKRAELETRYWELPTTRASIPNAVGAAVSRDKVMELVTAFESAGWLCMGVDASATALARFGSLLREWRADEVWGMLDLGQRQARAVICLGHVPVLVRSVGSGGGEWTDRIAQSLQVSPRAAEIHKREYGIRGGGTPTAAGETTGNEGPGGTATAELSGILLGILRSELRELAGEIKRSFEYVLSCYPGSSPTELILVGGGAAMPGVPQHLASALGIPVQRASSCLEESGCQLRYSSGKRSGLEEMAAAIGAALEG
ncbi:MAG: hypothetical protein J5J06_04490 [Phycisphaerae bacterium]|nr:hypothetical protein [Phycisphaerae bacterium]